MLDVHLAKLPKSVSRVPPPRLLRDQNIPRQQFSADATRHVLEALRIGRMARRVRPSH
jgi:hypothetical protein